MKEKSKKNNSLTTNLNLFYPFLIFGEIFFFVADHSTEGRGTFDLSMNDFHIPAWVYAPKILTPQKISKLVAQLDLLPTLFGLLNFSYESHFIGHDVFDAKYDPDIYIGNYQHVGFFEENHLVTFGPKRSIKNYSYDPVSMVQTPTNVEREDITSEAISIYQYSSSNWKSGLMKEVIGKKVIK